MSKDKKITSILIVSLVVLASTSFSAEEPKVTLQKVEGRTEAVVSPTAAKEEKLEEKSIWAPFSLAEKGIMQVASTTTGLVGKGTDISVKAVQTASGFLLSPFFKAIDFVKRGEANRIAG